jgi:hypothetical protein
VAITLWRITLQPVSSSLLPVVFTILKMLLSLRPSVVRRTVTVLSMPYGMSVSSLGSMGVN